MTRQAACKCISVLAVHLAGHHPDRFMPCADAVAVTAVSPCPATHRGGGISDGAAVHLRASAAACAGVLCECLRERMVKHIPALVPALLAAVGATGAALVVLRRAAAGTLHAAAKHLARFMAPYLPQLLSVLPALAVSTMDGGGSDGGGGDGCSDNRGVRVPADVASHASVTLALLAAQLEPRVFLAAATAAYDGAAAQLVDSNGRGSARLGVGAAAARLLKLIGSTCARMDATMVKRSQQSLLRFLIGALALRERAGARRSAFGAWGDGTSVEDGAIDFVEATAVETLVTFVLRLSERQFRPAFFHLCSWAMGRDGGRDGWTPAKIKRAKKGERKKRKRSTRNFVGDGVICDDGAIPGLGSIPSSPVETASDAVTAAVRFDRLAAFWLAFAAMHVERSPSTRLNGAALS